MYSVQDRVQVAGVC